MPSTTCLRDNNYADGPNSMRDGEMLEMNLYVSIGYSIYVKGSEWILRKGGKWGTLPASYQKLYL